MIFGAYSGLLRHHPVFQNTSYEKIVLVEELESHANTMLIELRKRFDYLPVQAAGSVTATGNPGNTETITIAGIVYKFMDATVAPYDIKIGTDKEETILNLHSGIMEAETGEYHANTFVNVQAESLRTDHILALLARKAGNEGNNLSLSTTSTNLTVVAFSGGLNEVPILTSLNLRLTALSLLSGKAVSSESGGSGSPSMTKLTKQIEDAWKTIRTADGLPTKDGNYISASSNCPIGSSRPNYDDVEI